MKPHTYIFLVAAFFLGGCATTNTRVIDLTSPAKEEAPTKAKQVEGDAKSDPFDFTR